MTACVLGHLLNTNNIRSESLVSFPLPLEVTNTSNKKKKIIKFHICAHTRVHSHLFWIYIQWGCLLPSSPDKRCKSMCLHPQEQPGLTDIPRSTRGAEQCRRGSTHCRKRRINPCVNSVFIFPFTHSPLSEPLTQHWGHSGPCPPSAHPAPTEGVRMEGGNLEDVESQC